MRVRRTNLADLSIVDGRATVRLGQAVLALSGPATVILQSTSVDETRTIEDLTSALIAEFGEPEPPYNATDLLMGHLYDLSAHGLVQLQGATCPADSGPSRSVALDSVRSALRYLRSDTRAVWNAPVDLAPREFVAAAHQHHVVSLLASNLDRLGLAPDAAANLRAAGQHHDRQVELLAAELCRALDVLDRVGVRAIAFKGLALAVLAYGDLEARGPGDLDLLVSPKDVERAYAALESEGWSNDDHYPRPGATWAWRHLRRTGYEVSLSCQTSSVDLHWHLTPSASTFPPFEVLWRRRNQVRIGDRDVPTLAPYDALAHSAGHAAKDRWRWLRSLVDVHQLAGNSKTWVDADRPLRRDQLQTVGLAARMFGVPEQAPSVVREALSLTPPIWYDTMALQLETDATHPERPNDWFLTRGLATARQTSARPRDWARLLSANVLPPWLTVDELSPHGWIAVPRSLARRVRRLGTRL